MKDESLLLLESEAMAEARELSGLPESDRIPP